MIKATLWSHWVIGGECKNLFPTYVACTFLEHLKYMDADIAFVKKIMHAVLWSAKSIQTY
jgi:hypothetical protein